MKFSQINLQFDFIEYQSRNITLSRDAKTQKLNCDRSMGTMLTVIGK